MKKSFPFRLWFYFRNGWGTYFSFVFAAINTLTVTYFLAIDHYPILKDVFPTFPHYVIITTIIGVPILVGVGYAHFKKTHAYSAEADVVQESHPYNFRLLPGWTIEVVFPLYLMLSEMMIKWSKNEKLNDDDIKQIYELQKKIDVLLKGGMVGKPRQKSDTDFSIKQVD